MQLRTSFQKIYADEAQHIDLFKKKKKKCNVLLGKCTKLVLQTKHAMLQKD